MARYEFQSGSSSKFWDVSRSGSKLRITYGRIGTSGATLEKAFANEAAAVKEHDQLVASKLKKGYVAAKGGAKKTAAAPPKKKATRAPAKKAPAKAPTGPTFSLPPPRPERSISLMELSGCGQIPPDLDQALEYPERARYVSLDDPSPKLLKLRKVHKIEGLAKVPSWFGKLRHLRVLIGTPNSKKLPAELVTLPKLRFLHLDGADLTDLAGLEKLASLESFTFGDTPVADNEEARRTAEKRVGGKDMAYLAGIDRKPRRAPAPRDRKKLVAAIKADTLDDCTDLRKVDLRGETFEDLYVTYNFRGANLAGTTWLRCDFEWGSFVGADLTGATFDDCYFSGSFSEGMLEKTQARGVTFVGCGGDIGLRGADVRDGKLLSLESDTGVQLHKANAQGLQLQISFCSEKEHRVEAKGADLRGAHIEIDVTPGRRAEIKKKKGSRYAWKQDHFKGARTDKTTQILYAPLTGDETPRGDANATVDRKGAAATSLGTLSASNASLWCVVFDGKDGTGWRGTADDEDFENDPKNDFNRALKIEEGPITTHTAAKGQLVRISFEGWSEVWRVDGGIAMINGQIQSDDRAEQKREMSLRVAQWPVPKKPKRLGKVSVKSGALAIMLPYAAGDYSAAELAKAAKGTFVTNRDHDRLLVPVPNGTYSIWNHPFSPNGEVEYEDEVGSYVDCVRITRDS